MEEVEQSQLVMKQFLLAMTINIAGLSAHSKVEIYERQQHKSYYAF